MAKKTRRRRMLVNRPHPAIAALVERMSSFDGHFQGYPSDCEPDLELIQEAIKAYMEETGAHETFDMAILCCLASVHITDVNAYQKARSFINAFVESCWECNMTENSNPAHDKIFRRSR